ncbi:hypothetical protein GCM10020229_31330 [Kitasatospora albolonga]
MINTGFSARGADGTCAARRARLSSRSASVAAAIPPAQSETVSTASNPSPLCTRKPSTQTGAATASTAPATRAAPRCATAHQAPAAATPSPIAPASTTPSPRQPTISTSTTTAAPAHPTATCANRCTRTAPSTPATPAPSRTVSPRILPHPGPVGRQAPTPPCRSTPHGPAPTAPPSPAHRHDPLVCQRSARRRPRHVPRDRPRLIGGLWTLVNAQARRGVLGCFGTERVRSGNGTDLYAAHRGLPPSAGTMMLAGSMGAFRACGGG